MDETAKAIEVLGHVVGIDDEFVDDIREAGKRKVERDRRVRADHPFDRGMRNVALVPERDILQSRRYSRAYDPGKAGEILGQDRIALMRHGGGARLPLGEIFLGSKTARTLERADFGREPLD